MSSIPTASLSQTAWSSECRILWATWAPPTCRINHSLMYFLFSSMNSSTHLQLVSFCLQTEVHVVQCGVFSGGLLCMWAAGNPLHGGHSKGAPSRVSLCHHQGLYGFYGFVPPQAEQRTSAASRLSVSFCIFGQVQEETAAAGKDFLTSPSPLIQFDPGMCSLLHWWDLNQPLKSTFSIQNSIHQ